MAGYQDWMNPNPQAAHTDRLLNDPRNPTILGPGSFQPTRERVDPRWQVPWQGNADFVTDIPGNARVDQWQERTDFPGDPLRMENQLIPHHLRPEAEFDPATGQMRVKQEEVPQTQRPARRVVPFPEGQSMNRTPIANNFMDKIKSMFGLRGSTY